MFSFGWKARQLIGSILFVQGSPWSNEISLAILNFHESGVMEELETTWIDTKKCAEQSNSPATLGLNHMLGVYLGFSGHGK